MTTELFTLIGVLANLAWSIFKEVRRSRCSLGWGFCSCATVTKGKSESRVSEPSPIESPKPVVPVPSEYKVAIHGLDLDKAAIAASMDEDWRLAQLRG